jgi:DNA polymerase I-like protein with 3'-5' exonuclease and polymerase domains
MRCYFNPAGTETYRFSSSEDAFGSGTNLQNIPRGLEDEAIDITELVQYELPNIRKLFKPDTEYTIGEVDLAGADAQIVAWEAEDEILKEFFRKKLKLHIENGKMMYGAAMMGVDGKREPYYTRVKTGVHLTNYGGKAKTAAAAMNVTVHEAERFQQRWFEIHPAILEWHKRTQHELNTTRMVSNKFGFRRFYFDRIEDLLPEALAWKPQSTVALVANQGLINTSPHRLFSGPLSDFCQNDRHPNIYDLEIMSLRTRLKELGFQMLLQVHDSLVFQYPTRAEYAILPLLRKALTVTVPYNDPLIIPWGLKTSTVNWGEAKERAWPEVVVVN